VLPDLDLHPMRTGRRKLDVAICLALLLAVGLCVWSVTGIGGHVKTLIDARADDVWFEADVARVFNDMTDRGANHYKTTVHPLFPLLLYPVIHVIQTLFQVDALRAVRGVVAAAAGLWMAAFYFLLRLLRCRQPDAVLFALVAAATSAGLFWTAIPETYQFGSVTILGVLIVAAIAARRGSVPAAVDVTAGAASMSILVTDFLVNLASLISRHRLKQAIQIACNALVVVVLLWGLQKYFFTSAQFFIGEHDKGVPPPSRFTALVVILLHSFVAPGFWSLPNELQGEWPKLSYQHAGLGTLDFLKVTALISWICLLGFAAWALVRVPLYPRFRIMLALSLVGQIALHLLYGNETFLYAMDWMPLFVTAAALATLTHRRWVVLALAGVFLITAGIHNGAELRAALDTVVTNAQAAQPVATGCSDSGPRPGRGCPDDPPRTWRR
jgi:hypothetical protein